MIISLGIQGKYTEVVLDSGASYNLMDTYITRTLSLQVMKLSENTFLSRINYYILESFKLWEPELELGTMKKEPDETKDKEVFNVFGNKLH